MWELCKYSISFLFSLLFFACFENKKSIIPFWYKFNFPLLDISNKLLNKLSLFINSWQLNPVGTEGYRTAEVTLGGVDTKEISSKTMMSVKYPGLFFIGEVVDVTGHLGGYNFQWAWSSGYVAGQHTW